MNRNSNIFFAPDGAQSGDPASFDIAGIGKLLSSRIIAINDNDTEENAPMNPDRPRMLNYPQFDTSPINFTFGGTVYNDLQKLCEDAGAMLKLEREMSKKNGSNKPARFIKVSAQTDKQLLELRCFSFKALSSDGYATAEIWRKTKVHGVTGSGEMIYGKRVSESTDTVKIPESVKQDLIAADAAFTKKPGI
jgi:hypothetical protein